jgi:ribose transport system substrate-binding protein
MSPRSVVRVRAVGALAATVLASALLTACVSVRVGVGGRASDLGTDRGSSSVNAAADGLAIPSDGSPAPSGRSSGAADGSQKPHDGCSIARGPSAVTAVGPSSMPGGRPSRQPSPSFAPRIGYISLDDDLVYVRAVSDGIRAAAVSAGLELVECDPDWTREGVLECAERLADIGIDGLVSFQPFADLASDVCEVTGMVPTAGIVFDQGPCEVTRLRIDQAEAGRLAGEHVGRIAERRWDCEISAFVSLGSSEVDPDGQARMEGYRSGYQERCPLPERSPVLLGADRLITAQAAMSDLLQRLRGRRIVVVGINEDAILGAMAAAEDAGRAADLWYSGQLADPAIRSHIACDRRYLASVAQFPERFGAQVLPPLAQALRGGTAPGFVDAALVLVTADNVRELFPDTPPCER